MSFFRGGLVCVVVFSLVSTACAQVGKVTVVVTDYDTNEPLPDTRVIAGFAVYHGLEAGNSNRVECVTDSEGVCSLIGRGNGGSVAVAVMTTNRYYGASEEHFFKGGLSPIATPWNPTIELRLKAVRKPIRLYAKQLYKIEIPKEDEPIGYDLEKGDWVAPFGEGAVSDFVLTITREPVISYIPKDSVWGREYKTYGATLEVTGSNDDDGFVPVPVSERDRHRGLRLPYEAPLDGYEGVVSRYVHKGQDKPSETNIQEDQNYFFRVRTEKDEEGDIISALYGKIHGDFRFTCLNKELSFTYYLNPTSNDRNLEFDLGHSLFEDLSSIEKVKDR